MFITEDNLALITQLKQLLNTHLRMKDLGDLRYFLGLEVVRSKQGIFISQMKYVLDLLQEVKLTNARSFKTPMEANLKLILQVIYLMHLINMGDWWAN